MARPRKEVVEEVQEAETPDTDLVSISKDGEPDLKIHIDALDEHIRLGWAVTE